uniref:Uncharacterized protein n=1 Tax=Arundo donax TaxID=35708 RepID=A0A0A9BS53_ARUDO
MAPAACPSSHGDEGTAVACVRH